MSPAPTGSTAALPAPSLGPSRRFARSVGALAGLGVFAAAVLASAPAQATRRGPGIDQTIARVEAMPFDADVRRLAAAQGLDVVNVTWEDTGRWSGSSVGPNISDMTIGVRDAAGALHAMPVFRFDNFTDVTADLPADDFWLPVGNAWGRDALRAVPLSDVLTDTRRFLHDPRSWSGDEPGLWAERDATVLVSAQACFLPVPAAGEATFTPVLYNYQSRPDHPAVLTIIASRQGTSMQVIENDQGYLSEPLFFNADGERAPFTAVRQSDVRSGRVDAGPGGPLSAAGEDSANVVLVVQVPLKQEAVDRWSTLAEGFGAGDFAAAPAANRSAQHAVSDVEDAVIGHGPAEGPHKELNGLEIERDPRFPVRVTVQFYKATSNGVVTADDVAALRRSIDRVYADASWVGSLVTEAPRGRPTDWRRTPTANATWARPVGAWHRSL